MALRFADNFEFWTVLPGTFTSHSNASISSGKLSTGFFGSATITLDSQGTWIVNVRHNMNNSATEKVITFLDAASFQCYLARKPNGKLAFFRGDNTQVGSDSSVTLVLDNNTTYYDIEVKVILGNTGSVVVKVNGQEVINASSVDITTTANNTADSIRFGNGNNSITEFFDQVIVMDGTGSVMNDFIGPVNVNSHIPDADGNYTTWTANTGTRFGAVDDAAPNSDTDYVSAATVGDKVTFTTTNLPSGVTTVKAFGVWTNSKRDDGTTRAYKILLRSSTTDNLGPIEHFVGSTYGFFFTPYDISPFTSSAWTTTEINGLEIGAQVTT